MDSFGNKQEEIFSFGIDEVAKAHMLETARWGKFLAIISFIGLGLLVLVGILSGFILSATGQSNVFTAGVGIGMTMVYLLIAALYFYPTWALFQFSKLSKQAILTSNQQQFNESQRYLKNIFKFLGIMAIIVLAIYGLAIVFIIIGAAVAGF